METPALLTPTSFACQTDPYITMILSHFLSHDFVFFSPAAYTVCPHFSIWCTDPSVGKEEEKVWLAVQCKHRSTSSAAANKAYWQQQWAAQKTLNQWESNHWDVYEMRRKNFHSTTIQYTIKMKTGCANADLACVLCHCTGGRCPIYMNSVSQERI